MSLLGVYTAGSAEGVSTLKAVKIAYPEPLGLNGRRLVQDHMALHPFLLKDRLSDPSSGKSPQNCQDFQQE